MQPRPEVSPLSGEQLAGFASADALLDFARGREVGPVQPRVVTEGETTRLLLPGEPGYDD